MGPSRFSSYKKDRSAQTSQVPEAEQLDRARQTQTLQMAEADAQRQDQGYSGGDPPNSLRGYAVYDTMGDLGYSHHPGSLDSQSREPTTYTDPMQLQMMGQFQYPAAHNPYQPPRMSLPTPNMQPSSIGEQSPPKARTSEVTSGVTLGHLPPRPKTPCRQRTLLEHEIRLLLSFARTIQFTGPLRTPTDVERWYYSWYDNIDIYMKWSDFMKRGSSVEEFALRKKAEEDHRDLQDQHKKNLKVWVKRRDKAAGKDPALVAAAEANLRNWGSNPEEQRNNWRLHDLKGTDRRGVEAWQPKWKKRRDSKDSNE